jgi:hypothetical protein
VYVKIIEIVLEIVGRFVGFAVSDITTMAILNLDDQQQSDLTTQINSQFCLPTRAIQLQNCRVVGDIARQIEKQHQIHLTGILVASLLSCSTIPPADFVVHPKDLEIIMTYLATMLHLPDHPTATEMVQNGQVTLRDINDFIAQVMTSTKVTAPPERVTVAS